jgi:3-methyladenine DNA glycosylase AlkD
MQNTVHNILEELNKLAYEKRKDMYLKQGIKENIIGVNLGDLRKIANKIKMDHSLALQLWETDVYEARVIASKLLDPTRLSLSDLERLITSTQSGPVIDELSFQIFEQIDNQINLFDKWITNEDPRYKRAGWNMGIILNHESKFNQEKLIEIVNNIENNLAQATLDYQFAMNRCLCEVGIKHDSLTEKCISVGEKLGIYKDMKVSKGCTSPYAPIWINTVRKKMVK